MTRLTALILILLPTLALAQKRVANTGTVTFYSQKLNITGENISASGTLDLFTGEVAIDVPVEAFRFKKKWMWKKFNSKGALNSERHPFITFSGMFVGLKGRELKKLDKVDGTLRGTLTIKGTTRDISENALLEVRDETATLTLDHVLDRFAYGLKRRKWFVSQELDCSLKIAFK